MKSLGILFLFLTLTLHSGQANGTTYRIELKPTPSDGQAHSFDCSKPTCESTVLFPHPNHTQENGSLEELQVGVINKKHRLLFTFKWNDQYTFHDGKRLVYIPTHRSNTIKKTIALSVPHPSTAEDSDYILSKEPSFRLPLNHITTLEVTIWREDLLIHELAQ